MKKFTKTLVAIIAVTTMLSMFGCGSKNTEESKSTEKNTEDVTTKETTEAVTEAATEAPTKASLSPKKASEEEYYKLKEETLQYTGKDENFKYEIYETYVKVTGTVYKGELKEVSIPSVYDELPVKIIDIQSAHSYFSRITIPESIIAFHYEEWNNSVVNINFEGDAKKVYFPYKQRISGADVSYTGVCDFETLKTLLLSYEDESYAVMTINVRSDEKIALFELPSIPVIAIFGRVGELGSVVVPESCRKIHLEATSGIFSIDELTIPKDTEIALINIKVGLIKTYKGAKAVQFAADRNIPIEILDK